MSKVHLSEKKYKIKKRGKMFKQLWCIIKKNIKLILRSRSSSLIVVLGPLLVIILLGVAYNTSSLNGLKVGVYSSSYNDLSNSIVTKLEDDQFDVVKVEGEENCIEGVKNGEMHICTVLPPDLKVESGDRNIIFYADFSRINLVGMVVESVSTKVSAKSTELSAVLTTGLLNVIGQTETEIIGKKSLLEELAGGNSDVKNKVDGLYSNLLSINLNYSDDTFKIDQVKQTIEEINISDADQKDELLGAVDNVGQAIRQRFDEVKLQMDSSKPELDAIKSTLDVNVEKINQMGSGIANVENSISGLSVRSADIISSPITTTIKPIIAEKTYLNYLFPTLLVLTIMFVSVLLSAIMVIREKISPAYLRNFLSPTKDAVFFLGNYLTNVFVVVLQLVIVLGVASFFFKSDMLAILVNIPLVLGILTTVFILLGMLIGYAFKSEETATLAAISSSSIMLFFSNAILPLESLPEAFKEVVNYNPFVIGETVLKKMLLFGSTFEANWSLISILFVYIAVLFVLILVLQKASKETYRIKRKIEEKREKKSKIIGLFDRIGKIRLSKKSRASREDEAN